MEQHLLEMARIHLVDAPRIPGRWRQEYDGCLRELQEHPGWYNGYRLIGLHMRGSTLDAYHGDYALTRMLHQNPEAAELGLGSLWAGVLFYDGEGRVMLARRAADMGSYAGMWALPCTGGFEGDESPRRAIHREIVEEWGPDAKPGLAIQNSEFLATIWNPTLPGSGVGFVWSALVAQPELLRADPREIAEWDFFQPDQLPGPQAPDLGRLVELWLQSRS